MKCADIMAARPSCCKVDDSVLRAAEIMRTEDVGSVPVVMSQSDRRVIGIVTDRDLTLRLIAEGKAPEVTTVSEVMTRSPVTCMVNDDVQGAMQTMSRHQVRRVPVVDERGELCGIISQADIARHLDERQAGEVLEDISQPGHNTIGRAFRKTATSTVHNGESHTTDWLLAAGIGAALGAGLMAIVDHRRVGSSEHSRQPEHASMRRNSIV